MAATLTVSGIVSLRDGNLVGLVPLIVGVGLLISTITSGEATRMKAAAFKNRVPAPAIQDDGSLR